MKQFFQRLPGSIALVVMMASVSQATTITFSGGSNADIPATYGSNIVADAAGFVTTDGSGATPDISLTWAPLGNVWEFHNGGGFTGNGFDPAVAQIDVNNQSGVPPADPTIFFEATPTTIFELNSLDIGNATDQIEAAYAWTISLIRESDSATVFSHTTALLDASVFIETVPINFVGDPGENYTLLFDDGGANTVRSAIDNLSFSQSAAPGAPAFGFTVDRDTGSLTLENSGTGAGEILAYSITSAVGGLDQASWNTIAENYDVGSPGPNQIDADDNWTVLSDPASHTDLSELESDGGNGASIGAMSSVDLSTAGGWIQNPDEDIQVELLLPDGTIQELAVTYTGNSGASFEAGDMDFNGTVDALDWLAYNANRGEEFSGLSEAEAYQVGDYDFDGDNDIADFIAFKSFYEDANGPGSFAEIANVPEPSSMILLVVGGMLLGAFTSRRRRVKTELYGAVGSLVLFIALAGNSQATTITFSGGSNADIPANYGSNIGESAAGFDTTDGSGKTFDIALTWAPTPNVWEFHNSNTFADNGFDVAVGQLDVDGAGVDDPTIFFETAPGTALVLNSLDIGNAVDQTEAAYAWTISIIRESDSATVFSHTTVDLDETPFIETVSFNFTGDVGENYTLLFDDGGANSVRSAIDNLSFSQIAVDPLKMIVNRASGRVVVRNDSGLSLDFNSYEMSSASNSLDDVAWNSLEEQDYEGNGAPGTGNGWEKAGGVGTDQLIESYLLASSVLADGDYISLGNAYDHDKVGGAEDLAFGYHRTDLGGFLLDGDVEYFDGLGDMNGDGVVDTDDVNPFVQALTDRAAYDAAYPDIDADLIGNVNEDGSFNLGDVAAFKALVASSGTGNAVGSVPEPGSLTLLSLCLTCLVVSRRKSRVQ